MVVSSHPQPNAPPQLLRFLQQKLGLSQSAIDMGLRPSEIAQAPLPVVLWRFGLLTLRQYQEVLDWETSESNYPN